ncbi:MAG: alpha-L-fucosidase, partial [Bacilli bacterium]|nr:alpha-L-fucosidase [Bacilli bacterium]
MDCRNTLKLKYPSSWWGAKWREALPAGNGEMGAAVYGGVYEETVLLTHEDLWWKGLTPEMPDVSDKLPEVRELIMQGSPKEAERILADTFGERGYQPKIAKPLPLGDLKVIMPGKNAFKNYSRMLNMETGEISVSWLDGQTHFERKLFVSRTDDLIVYSIQSEGCDLINARVQLDLHDRSDSRQPNRLTLSDLPDHVECRAEGDYLLYSARNEDGTDFGAVGRIVYEGGSLVADQGMASFTGCKQVLICLKLFVKGNREQEWHRLREELSQVTMDYAVLLKSHAAEHGKLFNAMQLDLNAQGHERSNEELLLEAYQGEAPTALVEKMWSYGRYLLISSSREGGRPCPLHGLWCGEFEGMWAFNMTNVNLQMIYWQALSGNMPELLLTVFDYFESMMEDFRVNAKQIYGCRGIYVPAPTVPGSGLLKILAPHIIHWTGGAGWVAQHFYDYYKYTGDLEFLRKRALPFMREAALFYEDFFFQGEDGYLISCPSNSPENTPGNYKYGAGPGAGKDMGTTANATMDFAIAKEVLLHLIDGSHIANQYTDDIEKWQAMLKRIPPYQINEDGAVREWMHPQFQENYHHRHMSHTYPVFPGDEITREDNPVLFEAFVTAAKKRLVIGLKEQTSWSLAYMSNLYARNGEGDLALECLDIISRSCLINNFYTFHNDWRNMGIGVDMSWAPFQIDANM